MNIFNRPPAIAEDSLHYFLDLGNLSSNKIEALAFATYFQSHVISKLLPGHIWHRDAFELNVSRNKEGMWNLEGTMRVGDSIDDEWCVVWLLQEISRKWDVAVRVYDSDGEFLLIEAANALPDWITPENAENRVWIYRGRLHIVPLKYSLSEGSTRMRREERDDDDTEGAQAEVIGLLEAVQAVRDPAVNTLAIAEIENIAFERIKKYPDAARQHVHRTNVYVPREVAMALTDSPELVQKAVEAFYTRDPLQMRDAARMARFPPTNTLLATVKLTRTAYAQLMSQKFYPPRVFGTWRDTEGGIERRHRDIGMKIACGFEMVYQESKTRSYSAAKDASNLQAIKADSDYQAYISKLKEIGFFDDAMKDPQKWKSLEIRCTDEYVRNNILRENDRPSFRSSVDTAIANVQNRLTKGDKVEFVDEEDSDQWLSEAQLIMEEVISKHTDVATNDAPSVRDEETVIEEQASQLRNLANEVEKFVEGKGDTEGALFDDDRNDVSEPDSDDESMGDSASEVNAVPPSKQSVLDSIVPPLDPSDYGRMPASYHDKSQKVKESYPETQDSQNINAPLEVPSNKRGSTSTSTTSIRPLLFPRDRYDGVEDSDDDEMDAEEDEEEHPTLEGDVEIDMDNEQEEFIEFSRELLGITPDMWNSIIVDRQNRGVFVPSSSKGPGGKVPHPLTGEDPDESQREEGNSDLNSFEAVMDAMDVELRRIKERKEGNPKRGVSNPVPLWDQSQGESTVNDDIDEEMSAELKMLIQEDGSDEHTDYTLIKNFLESFRSQQGLSGPVSNLIGRLGWQLPRDTS